jgi:nitroreductase/Pyruvate/2-oxoacid:ferredoxin oxidoreductase delta subunit
MTLFTIDESKCKHDGICVAECPMKIIVMADENSPPMPTADAAEKCIQCGHCVAVCPHGAFSHSLMKDDDFPAIDKDWILSIDQAEQFLRSRRSIRAYKKKAVEANHLTRLIEIARYAPTGTNSQQVNWLVVNSREEVTKLTSMVIDLLRVMIANEHPMSKRFNLTGFVTAWEQGIDIISRGAPTLVMTHAPKDYGLAQVDCTSALAYFDLTAPTLGLGTCWAGFFMIALTQYQPLVDALGLPDGHGVFGAMMTGYPKFKYKRLVPRKAPNITWK